MDLEFFGRAAGEDSWTRIRAGFERWWVVVHAEADEQAGREPDTKAGQHNSLDDVLIRIREGVDWLWELPGGEVVHLTGAGIPQANPTSNRSYASLGYEPVVDMGEHLVER